jgi:hypothetical protein
MTVHRRIRIDKMSDEERGRILKLNEIGLTPKAIAQRMGIASHAVCKLLKVNGQMRRRVNRCA